jgi:hypothetical protein
VFTDNAAHYKWRESLGKMIVADNGSIFFFKKDASNVSGLVDDSPPKCQINATNKVIYF